MGLCNQVLSFGLCWLFLETPAECVILDDGTSVHTGCKASTYVMAEACPQCYQVLCSCSVKECAVFTSVL